MGTARLNVVRGIIDVDSLLTFESQQLGSSWFKSNWLGIFNYYNSGWVYHERLGWFYLHDDGRGNFWFWDPIWSTWWWSSGKFSRGFIVTILQIGTTLMYCLNL